MAQSVIMASPFAIDSYIVAHLVHISEHMSHIRMDISEFRIMKSRAHLATCHSPIH